MTANRHALVRQDDGSWALPPGFTPCPACRLHIFDGAPETLRVKPGAFIYSENIANAQHAKLLAAVKPHYHCGGGGHGTGN